MKKMTMTLTSKRQMLVEILPGIRQIFMSDCGEHGMFQCFQSVSGFGVGLGVVVVEFMADVRRQGVQLVVGQSLAQRRRQVCKVTEPASHAYRGMVPYRLTDEEKGKYLSKM